MTNPTTGKDRVERNHGFIPHTANETGEYPVNPKKLRNTVGPSVIHTLDAFFSALVMERLAARGIMNFVALHDAWCVPTLVRDIEGQVRAGQDVLAEVIRDAGGAWFKGLEPVFDLFAKYLGDHPEFGPLVQKIRATWQARVERQDWPVFYAPPE